jgi:hypothetical protein
MINGEAKHVRTSCRSSRSALIARNAPKSPCNFMARSDRGGAAEPGVRRLRIEVL